MATAWLTLATASNAQHLIHDINTMIREKKHEYSAFGSLGMSFLLYNLYGDGETGDGNSTSLGFGYAYNFDTGGDNQWAALTGVEYARYGGSARYSSLHERYTAYDNSGTPPGEMLFDYTIKNFQEEQSVSMLSIPLMVRLTTSLSLYKNSFVYFAGGMKVGVPLTAKATAKGTLLSSGYYEYEDVLYTDLPNHGFFSNQRVTHSNKITAGVAAILTFESGMRFTVGNRALLYAGLQFDLTLNDLKKVNNQHPLNFTNGVISYESLLNSVLADKMKAVCVAIKLGIGIF
jgi:hypothetical protein